MVIRLAYFLIAIAAALAVAPASAQENELSFYTGIQEAPHSRVTGTDPGNAVSPTVSVLVGWEGRSFEAPPHYGFRYTRWVNETLGFGVDFNHTKVYADAASMAAAGFTNLELTDGLNILTANAWRRWPGAWGNGRLTPYVGAGVGVAIPHVDVSSAGGTTFEYQVTGPAAAWAAGVKYEINDRWGVFGEYKGTYSVNEMSLTNGGTLSSDILTNALNVGLSFNF